MMRMVLVLVACGGCVADPTHPRAADETSQSEKADVVNRRFLWQCSLPCDCAGAEDDPVAGITSWVSCATSDIQVRREDNLEGRCELWCKEQGLALSEARATSLTCNVVTPQTECDVAPISSAKESGELEYGQAAEYEFDFRIGTTMEFKLEVGGAALIRDLSQPLRMLVGDVALPEVDPLECARFGGTAEEASRLTCWVTEHGRYKVRIDWPDDLERRRYWLTVTESWD